MLLLIYVIIKTDINKNNIFKIINWIFLIVFTTAWFFSFSRAAWIGFFIGVAVLMALAVVNKNLKLQKGLAEIILIMGILIFILFSQYQNLLTSRLGGEGRLENKSTSERLLSYRESWQMIKNNWLTGAGIGNYTLALNQQVPNQQSFYYQPAHNVYLLVLSETGVFGFLFFIGLIIYAIILNFKFKILNYKENNINENNYLEITSAVLAAMIVIMSLDHWFWSLHFGVLFFWLIMGLILKKSDI
jgi:O-antigen ligase